MSINKYYNQRFIRMIVIININITLKIKKGLIYCIKPNLLKWQRYTILTQLHTLSLVIVKLLG